MLMAFVELYYFWFRLFIFSLHFCLSIERLGNFSAYLSVLELYSFLAFLFILFISLFLPLSIYFPTEQPLISQLIDSLGKTLLLEPRLN